MAVTLTVDLTDAEQTRLAEAAALIVPSWTPAQVKAWAEQTMKRRLRDEVRSRYLQALRDADDSARNGEMSTWDTDWTEVP